MKKALLLILITALFIDIGNAQFSKYIIRFKDKGGNPFSINNPSQFLSSRSVERRSRQRILIDSTDLPITPRYIDSVRLAGSVVILNKSKWLNQVCIQTTDAAALAKINSFAFVLAAQPLMRPEPAPADINKFIEVVAPSSTPQVSQATADFYNYGATYPQVHIHEGEFLHNNGFRGDGMLMAIIDDGFRNYLTVTAFDSARNSNRIIETYDFVNNEISVNEDDSHGMMCFSTIAGNIPGTFVGSCPAAKYYLYRTEDINSEYPIEEQNWVAAAERADSIGVDVFSTSLGYTTFTNPVFNHTYADLNGKITIIARANALAAKKGIISVVAAGNDGTGIWHYIGTPADADSIVTVGGTTTTGIVAGFSSYGPASDGRVKPTVASVGQGTALISSGGQVSFGNGTSFAAPNMAGLITCLWQAFQDFTNMEIIEAVKKSSSIFSTPNDRIGYGIPNFRIAFADLTQQRLARNVNALNAILGNDWIKVYPNPFKESFTVLLKPQNSGNATFSLYDAGGKLYLKKQVTVQQNQFQTINFDKLPLIAKGVYTLQYSDGLIIRSIKVLAQ